MMNITNWTARRAGGRITIKGTDAATGAPIKIVGVDTIARMSGAEVPPIATDKNGIQYHLA